MSISICDNVRDVLRRIENSARRVGRNPKEITLIGVTKTVDVARMLSAFECGITHFGENRAQSARKKWEELKDLPVTWHFIGNLQRNKVKYVVRFCEFIHSVESLELAREINKRAGQIGKVQKIMVEVNISGEETKHGIKPEEVENLVMEIEKLPNLKFVGLMTMAPFVEDPEEVRWIFRKLRELRDDILRRHGYDFLHLSMGMTNDFEVAVEEGATMVRIGTAIFGRRDE